MALKINNVTALEMIIKRDKYFYYQCNDVLTFGERLKTWRELNNYSIADVAEAIYSFRFNLGLENNKVVFDAETLEQMNKKSIDYDTYFFGQPIDYWIEEAREKKKTKRITSLKRTYSRWENTTTDFVNSPLSIKNLFILKQLIQCDYEFLFCEINTLHKETEQLTSQIGLNNTTIERLISFDKSYLTNQSDDSIAHYSYALLNTINLLISDMDLMMYLSYYLTCPRVGFANEHVSISKSEPCVPSKDSYLERCLYDIKQEDLHLIYFVTLSYKLSNLRNKNPQPLDSYICSSAPNASNNEIATNDDSLGNRLSIWREQNNLTQESVAKKIINYRIENQICMSPSTEIAYERLVNTTLRTYQNWESKKNKDKDSLISIQDLKMLKTIMDCDYEYLFGEINSLKKPKTAPTYLLGLTDESLKKLSSYKKIFLSNDASYEEHYTATSICRALDLIICDEDVLDSLTHFIGNMPFQAGFTHSTILKPLEIYARNKILYSEEYSKHLFNEEKNNEINNLFFPELCKLLYNLREKYWPSDEAV